MLFLGIDVGSQSTEAVLVDRQRRVLAQHVAATGTNGAAASERARAAVLAAVGAAVSDVRCTVACGYGRERVPFATRAVTEITCHARGAFELHPRVRTVIDIGGQDSKAIRLHANGRVADFVMNDKCAAGTGRFLDMMSRALEVPLPEMGPMALSAVREVAVSSMCAVFAESEVVGHLAAGEPVEAILAGLHRAVAQRVANLAARIDPAADVVMTGGVALNQAVVRRLGEALGLPVIVPAGPQAVGALGAAMIAAEGA